LLIRAIDIDKSSGKKEEVELFGVAAMQTPDCMGWEWALLSHHGS